MSWLWRVLIGASIVFASVWLSLWLAKQSPPPTGVAAQVPSSPAPAHLGDAGQSDGGTEPQLLGGGIGEGSVAPHPLSDALCPPAMNWVGGAYCPTGAQREGRCKVEPRQLGFCMDQLEYPNQAGVLPSVMVSFTEAAQYCKAEGKRLCSEGEWTFACREVQRLGACNFGRTGSSVKPADYWNPATVARTLEANEGRRRSGASDCQSPWAVFDLLGNVQEWVSSEHVASFAGAAKGGHYNLSSIDCERSIQTRQADLRYPHTGFRCCVDPLVRIPRTP